MVWGKSRLGRGRGVGFGEHYFAHKKKKKQTSGTSFSYSGLVSRFWLPRRWWRAKKEKAECGVVKKKKKKKRKEKKRNKQRGRVFHHGEGSQLSIASQTRPRRAQFWLPNEMRDGDRLRSDPFLAGEVAASFSPLLCLLLMLRNETPKLGFPPPPLFDMRAHAWEQRQGWVLRGKAPERIWFSFHPAR
jgi:hypothetical protein